MLPAFTFTARLDRGPRANPNRKIWVLKYDGWTYFIPAVRWDGTIKTLPEGFYG